LKLLKGTTCFPVIEIKQEGTEKEIVDMLKQLDMIDEAMICSFSFKALSEVKKAAPELRVSYTFGEVKGTPEETSAKIIEDAKKLGTEYINIHYKSVSPEFIKQMHNAGMKVHGWTVNDAAVMSQLLDWGIDSIGTDRADILVNILKERH